MKCLTTWMMSVVLYCSVAFGCTKNEPGQYIPVPTVANAKSFLALGDSYTIGESVSAGERFPAQTARLLQAKGTSVQEPFYVARTGWTTDDLQAAIGKTAFNPPYDIVTLLIGVNNQYQGKDTGDYRYSFMDLLRKAVELAGGRKDHVYVLSIPDYGVTPFGGGSARISKEIDAYNRINKEITLAQGVAYIDITPVSRKAATDPSFTAADGLHPSGKQYAEWAQALSAVVNN